jgi:hypothetical protein
MISKHTLSAEQKGARSKTRRRASPSSREWEARARRASRSPSAVERQLDWARQGLGGLEHAGERTGVRHAREHRGRDAEARERMSGNKQVPGGGVDVPAGRFVRWPIECDAVLGGVVASGVCGKVTGANEEEPQVPASDALDRASSAQQAIDHGFAGVHLNGAAVRSDQHHLLKNPSQKLTRAHSRRALRAGPGHT